MPIKLVDLLARVPPEVETRVKRVRDEARAKLQEAMRAECHLTMRTPKEAEDDRPGAQVPVDINAGYPAILDRLDFADDFELSMLLGRYRAVLEKSKLGVTGLLELRNELERRENLKSRVQATETELQSTVNWARALLKFLDEHDPLNTVFAVEEDFLGVYEYGFREGSTDQESVNKATVHLYWGIIGLVSEWIGCTVEDLAIVVLTHELAHAYTQLGADIEGRRWPSDSFRLAEMGLTEGLAQYYTDRVLRRLERRYGGALKVFETMLPRQPAAYQTHESWVKEYSPESVRRAMLEVRRRGEGKLEDFNRRLAGAKIDLQ